MARSDAISRLVAKLEEYRYRPTDFCREFLDIDPHDGQRRWFRNSVAPENALTCGNRWGKSTAAGAKAIFKAVYRKGWTPEELSRYVMLNQPYRAINVSISAQQSRLVWDAASRMLVGKKASWLVRDSKQAPFPRIDFFNGAIFEARTTGSDGKYLLGENYDHANWDEAAFEPKFKHVRDNVLRMRLVDRHGTLDYTSTGNGRNDYGRYFLTGLPGPKKDPLLYSQTGPTTENPNVDHARIAQNAARMSDRMRRQNILGEIVDSGGAFFSADDIDAATDTDAQLGVCEFDEEERERHVVVYHEGVPWVEAFPGHRYVHGWDLADKSDWTVGGTWDISVTPHKLVEFERFNRMGWAHVYDRIRRRHNHYGYGETWVDSTGIGDVILEELADIGAKGVRFTATSKAEMLGNVQSLLSLRGLSIPPIRVMLEEMRFYERDDKNLVTDCVMSLAVASEGMRRGGGYAYAVAI